MTETHFPKQKKVKTQILPMTKILSVVFLEVTNSLCAFSRKCLKIPVYIITVCLSIVFQVKMVWSVGKRLVGLPAPLPSVLPPGQHTAKALCDTSHFVTGNTEMFTQRMRINKFLIFIASSWILKFLFAWFTLWVHGDEGHSDQYSLVPSPSFMLRWL